MSTRVAHVLIPALTLALGVGCSTQNADLELEAAKKAMSDAAKAKASDCAKALFQSAEAKLAEAKALAEQEAFEDARARAKEAEALARQAQSSSPPGCEEPPEKAEVAPDPKTGSEAVTVSTTADLGSVEQTIYFDFNQASIREDGKALLTRVADLMRSDRGLKVEIEGHCDARGSTEYNLHLGERRAAAVKKYLVTQGIEESRVQTISYGEERPADDSSSEEAHERNRRAQVRRL